MEPLPTTDKPEAFLRLYQTQGHNFLVTPRNNVVKPALRAPIFEDNISIGTAYMFLGYAETPNPTKNIFIEEDTIKLRPQHVHRFGKLDKYSKEVYKRMEHESTQPKLILIEPGAFITDVHEYQINPRHPQKTIEHNNDVFERTRNELSTPGKEHKAADTYFRNIDLCHHTGLDETITNWIKHQNSPIPFYEFKSMNSQMIYDNLKSLE